MSLSWRDSFTWAAARCDHLEYETTLEERYEINQESTRKCKAIICFLQKYAFIFGYSLLGYLLETSKKCSYCPKLNKMLQAKVTELRRGEDAQKQSRCLCFLSLRH